MMKTALTIAGSDSSGGAGIQADIKTMMANGVYAMSAITALTAQNTTGVTAILNATPEFLAKELDAVFTDIYPDAVKIGMVSESELIRTIAARLQQVDCIGKRHNAVGARSKRQRKACAAPLNRVCIRRRNSNPLRRQSAGFEPYASQRCGGRRAGVC